MGVGPGYGGLLEGNSPMNDSGVKQAVAGSLGSPPKLRRRSEGALRLRVRTPEVRFLAPWSESGLQAFGLRWSWVERCSLPELVDFKLFGKTILVVNQEFKLFLASQLGK